MNIVETIRYINLRAKRKTITKLTKEEEELIIDRIIKHREFDVWFKDLSIRARTPAICEAAYLMQATEKGIKEVCDLTPARAIKNINDTEFLKDLIRTDFRNFDYLDFDKFSGKDSKSEIEEIENQKAYTGLIFEYYNQVNDSYLMYKNAGLEMPDDLMPRREMAGNLVDEARLFLDEQDKKDEAAMN